MVRVMSVTGIVIERRFCGPPASGNGGYCAGLLAERISGAVEVTLRVPPPLEQTLQLEHDAENARLLSGEQVIAEARGTSLVLDVPPAPSFEAAEACVSRFAGWNRHVFPTCFVCGPQRAAGDGLRIFPGPTADTALVAAPFVPDRSLAGPAGGVQPALVWAALDCPGYFAAASGEEAVLGRMTAQLVRVPAIGERCVVIGWSLGREGRKISAGTALFDDTGTLLGCARQTWVTLQRRPA